MIRVVLYFILLGFMFSACSSSPIQNNPKDNKTSQARELEWAIQFYESEHYQDALDKFTKLAAEGSLVPAYPFVPYYQGMCLFYLGRSQEAMIPLKSFITHYPDIRKAQEARMAILLSEIDNKNWEAASTLIAELEQFSLYSGERILIKLLGAQVLAEQYQITGAKEKIAEGIALLDDNYTNMNIHMKQLKREELHMRSLWTSALVDERECEYTKMPKLINKKEKKATLQGWIYARGKCFNEAISKSIDLYPQIAEAWQTKLTGILLEGIKNYTLSPHLITKAKLTASLPEAKALTKAAMQKTVYTMLETLGNLQKGKATAQQTQEFRDKLISKLEHLLHILSTSSYY